MILVTMVNMLLSAGVGAPARFLVEWCRAIPLRLGQLTELRPSI